MASTQVRPAEVADHTAATPAIEKEINELDEKVHTVDVNSGAVEPELDLYIPLDMDGSIMDEHDPLTIRSVIVGIILGSLVNASNLYLGKVFGFWSLRCILLTR